MLCGAWGLLAVGLFTSPEKLELAYGFTEHVGLFYEFKSGSFDAVLLLNQIMAILFVFVWSLATMGPFFVLLNYLGWYVSREMRDYCIANHVSRCLFRF